MLAVIPARGGSKGVPDKNIRKMAGEPLLAYTVQAALESGIFERVIVSTDSHQIAQEAERCGAEVPFMRPEELSGDLISSDDVIVHALNYYQKHGEIYETVCKLQPTSPLRTALHIREAYQLFLEREADSVISVCMCEHSPLWSGIIEEDLRLDFFISNDAKRACRQEMPTYYRLNGAIYMAKAECLTINKSFFGKNSIAYIMSQENSIDIDSELDFKIAEMLFEFK